MEYHFQVEKAVEYLVESSKHSDDSYSLSIAAYALSRAENPNAARILERLEGLSRKEKELQWWSNGDSSKDVEITSYIMLAKLESESEAVDKMLPVLKWLISKRNSNGGFSYTQDTVLGLQALIKFAEKTGAGDIDIEIQFKDLDKSERKGSIKINQTNDFVLPTHVVSDISNLLYSPTLIQFTLSSVDLHEN